MRTWTGKLEVDPELVGGLSKYPGTFEMDIVGEGYCQEALSKICGGKTPDGHNREDVAFLVPYDNPHDDQAVGVLMGDSLLVGHLSRVEARKFRHAMIAIGFEGLSLRVPALIIGGWDRGDGNEGHFGVKLDLPF